MPISGTDAELGQKMAAVAKGAAGDPDAAWKAVAKAIIDHFNTNALVTGVAPSGGGPIAEGKII